MNKMNKIYEAILKALGCRIKEDCQIVMVSNGKEYDILVDNKKTYLATNEAMNSLDNNRVFFHPACESITSKETEIDKVLRKLITSAIYFSFKPIAGVLIKAASKKSHKGVPTKVLEKLDELKNIDKRTEEQIISLVSRISMQTEYEGTDVRIVNYVLMRGGKTENDDHIYYRCTPSFPFYNELSRSINQNAGKDENAEVLFNEHRFTLKALKIVQMLFELVIPSCMNPSQMETISLQPTAARFCAMLRCFTLIAGDINILISKFRKDFDAVGMYGIETGWVEQLDDIGEVVGLIPPMDYNNYSTAGKTPDYEQDQNANLFNVLSNRNDVPQNTNWGVAPQPQYIQQSQQQQQQPQGTNVVPPAKDGEKYVGMTTLPNGLIEHRYQNGMNGRIVCAEPNGKIINESYINMNGQQQQPQMNQWGMQQPNPWMQQNPWGMQQVNPWGMQQMPQMNQFGLMQQPQQQVTPFSGGLLLPNGVMVPIVSQAGTQGSGIFDTPTMAPNTGGVGGMMSGTSGNW